MTYKRKQSPTGVYRITNCMNGKFYIGSATGLRGIQGRFSIHKSKLNRRNSSNPKLQCAWNKYGAGAFIFEILEHVQRPNNITDLQWKLLMLKREQYYLDTLLFASCNDNRFHQLGYNICRVAGNNTGVKLSRQTRAKIARALVGHRQSDATKLKRSWAQSGMRGNNSKLSKAQVDEMRKLYQQGVNKAEIARRFNVHHSTASRVIEKQTWKHI